VLIASLLFGGTLVTTCEESPCLGSDSTNTEPLRRALEIVSSVNNNTVNELPIEYRPTDPRTPEENALVWVVDEDPLQLDVTQDANRLLQRYSLYLLHNATGAPFANNSEVADESGWVGVGCSIEEPNDTFFCDGDKLGTSVGLAPIRPGST